jgi:predicted O-methyltransferase YrrM
MNLRQHAPPTPVDPGPSARWPIPEYLDRSARWMSRLAALYSGSHAFPASVSPESGLLLHSLARLAAPNKAVEIGCLLGVSSLWLAGALRPAHGDTPSLPLLHCIDLFGPPFGRSRAVEARRWLRVRRARLNLALGGVRARVRVHCGDSAEKAAALGADQGPIDFAYVDGDHSFEGVVRDLHALVPHLAPGAPVILHDVFPESGCEGPGLVIGRVNELFPGAFDLCLLRTAPRNYGFAVFAAKEGGHAAPRATQSCDPDVERLLLFALTCNMRPERIAFLGRAGPHLAAVVQAAQSVGCASVHSAAGPIAAKDSLDGPLPHPLRTSDVTRSQLGHNCMVAPDRPSFWRSIDRNGPIDLAMIDAAQSEPLSLSAGAVCDRLAPNGMLVVFGLKRQSTNTAMRGVPWYTGRYTGVRIGSVAMIQKRP